MARRPRRRHVRRLRRNPGKGPLLLGVALVGGVAAWWFLSGGKTSGGASKPDPRNLPQPPGCKGDTRVQEVNTIGPDHYLVMYADGRIGLVFPSGLVQIACADNSIWHLMPGHPWFQTTDAKGVQRIPPWDETLAKR